MKSARGCGIASFIEARGNARRSPGGEVLVRGTSGWRGRARLLASPWLRLRGLLGTCRGDELARLVLLTPCSSIHTFGMAYAIDVAFVSAAGVVVGSLRGVGPWRVESALGARYVLERPSSTAPWPQAGEELWLSELG